jgi:hypothetical protein
MYSTPELTDLIEYRSVWLQAEREFAISCFSIIGCSPASQSISEDVNQLNELEDLIDIKDARLALIETEKKGAIPIDVLIDELGL